MEYRNLTEEEIITLEEQRCTASDWNLIEVADDFQPIHIKNVGFNGRVRLGVYEKTVEAEQGFYRHSGISNAIISDCEIGDNCLIDNIAGHIHNYNIGNDCTIIGAGTISAMTGATFGQGNTIAVLNEGGRDNIVLSSALTSQMAKLMLTTADNAAARNAFATLTADYAERTIPAKATIGNGVKIVGAKEIRNTFVGDECEIGAALRINDSSLMSNSDGTVWIGAGVVVDCSIVMAGATVTDGAKVSNSFVGEACHVGRGFTSESSLFFANSYMDNGEACAALCGPFSVSHHKSTLLIGGNFSFYNAGSATNQSNHAYKMGPIHYGELQRGSKTASGTHILWPATSGAFSMLMGKIAGHPTLSDMPFSYVFGEGKQTFVVPGANFATVGTWRDVKKWPRRDNRDKANRNDIVNTDFLTPYIIQSVISGLDTLKGLIEEMGDDVPNYTWNGVIIKNSSLKKGISIYKRILQIYFGDAVLDYLPESYIGTGLWCDLSGLIAPKSEVDQLIADIEDNAFSSIEEIASRLNEMGRCYNDYAWTWTYQHLLQHLQTDTLSADDIASIREEGIEARRWWIESVKEDARKEYAMGDVSREMLDEFIDKVE